MYGKMFLGTKLQIPYQNWCNEETMAEHQSTPVLLPLWCQHLNFTTASTTCHFCALTLQPPPSADSVDVSESDMVVLDCQSLGHEVILCLQEWLGMWVSNILSPFKGRSFCSSTEIIKWRHCTQSRKRFRFCMANTNGRFPLTYILFIFVCLAPYVADLKK